MQVRHILVRVCHRWIVLLLIYLSEVKLHVVNAVVLINSIVFSSIFWREKKCCVSVHNWWGGHSVSSDVFDARWKQLDHLLVCVFWTVSTQDKKEFNRMNCVFTQFCLAKRGLHVTVHWRVWNDPETKPFPRLCTTYLFHPMNKCDSTLQSWVLSTAICLCTWNCSEDHPSSRCMHWPNSYARSPERQRIVNNHEQKQLKHRSYACQKNLQSFVRWKKWRLQNFRSIAVAKQFARLCCCFTGGDWSCFCEMGLWRGLIKLAEMPKYKTKTDIQKNTSTANTRNWEKWQIRTSQRMSTYLEAMYR